MAKKIVDTTKDQADTKLQKLKTRLSVARANGKDARKRWKEIDKVLDAKREYTVSGETQTSKITYPLAWAAYDNYLSELTSTPPQTIIDADGREDLVKKVFWKGILDHTKRRTHLNDLKEEFVDSFIQAGVAIYKVGRKVQTANGKRVAKGMKGETLAESESEAIIKNETFVEVVDPKRFHLSSETKYKSPVLGEECPYCIEEMVKLPQYIEDTYDVKLDDDEKELVDWQNEDIDSEEKHDNLPGENQDDLKRTRVYAYYGIWEIGGQTKPNCEVLFTNKRILKERVLPYQWGNKKPYIVVFNFKKMFKVLAKGCLDAVLDLDQEYNEHMNRLRTILRRLAAPKWAKLKGTVVDESALLDPDVGVIVDESQPNSFRPVEGPKTDPALFDKATAVEQLFYLLTGITYGASALNKQETATGQKMQERGTDTKMGRMIGKIERGQEELETMMLQLEQQYAPREGTDIRIVGADVVEMIRNKKFLYQTAMQQYQMQAQVAMQMGQPFDAPLPIDEYEKFQISQDGRSVITNYTRDDIQGQFELNIVSQSSNRSNRAIKSQQYLNAIGADKTGILNQPELWKRWFSLNDEDDPENLVNQAQMGMMPPGAPQPMQNVTTPNEANLSGAVEAQANQVV